MPTPITPEDIDHIRDLEEPNVEPMPEEISDINVGNLVEICVGPFMGFKGVVMKVLGHSATIDTLVFGRSTPVSVNITHLYKLMETYNEEKATEA
jgi:transcription antitermination factor NusG